MENNLLSHLNENNFFHGEIFSECQPLLKELETYPLLQAGIGLTRKQNTEIRSDYIHWIDDNHEYGQSVSNYLKYCELIKEKLNRNFYLGLKEFHCHYAQYEQGGFYKPHYDNIAGKTNRIVTFITYLTPDWKDGDGGELVIHTNEDKTIIPPKMGTSVCFFSQDVLHEVLPTKRRRMAITGWFTR